MDALSWILTFAVAGYVTVLTVKTAMPLYRYKKASGRVVKMTGKIKNFYGQEVKQRKEETVKSFYPIYECEVDGKRRNLFSLVRYIGEPEELIGKEIDMVYDKETDELWCEKDLPLMKKQIKIRIVTMVLLLTIMILTSILL